MPVFERVPSFLIALILLIHLLLHLFRLLLRLFRLLLLLSGLLLPASDGVVARRDIRHGHLELDVFDQPLLWVVASVMTHPRVCSARSCRAMQRLSLREAAQLRKGSPLCRPFQPPRPATCRSETFAANSRDHFASRRLLREVAILSSLFQPLNWWNFAALCCV